MINLLDALLTGAISSDISDEEAVKRYLETQNVDYYSLLYKRYSNKVFAKCISILKDDMKAEDAMQDIFMKVMLNLSKFKFTSKFSTWLYSITYNFCIDETRKRKKSVEHQVEDINNLGEDLIDEVSDNEILEIEVNRLKVIMDEMNENDKATLLMKYLDQMSIKEMCEVLEKSESAVKMQIKRAKEKFIRIHKLKYA